MRFWVEIPFFINQIQMSVLEIPVIRTVTASTRLEALSVSAEQDTLETALTAMV